MKGGATASLGRGISSKFLSTLTSTRSGGPIPGQLLQVGVPAADAGHGCERRQSTKHRHVRSGTWLHSPAAPVSFAERIIMIPSRRNETEAVFPWAARS